MPFDHNNQCGIVGTSIGPEDQRTQPDLSPASFVGKIGKITRSLNLTLTVKDLAELCRFGGIFKLFSSMPKLSGDCGSWDSAFLTSCWLVLLLQCPSLGVASGVAVLDIPIRMSGTSLKIDHLTSGIGFNLADLCFAGRKK